MIRCPELVSAQSSRHVLPQLADDLRAISSPTTTSLSLGPPSRARPSTATPIRATTHVGDIHIDYLMYCHGTRRQFSLLSPAPMFGPEQRLRSLPVSFFRRQKAGRAGGTPGTLTQGGWRDDNPSPSRRGVPWLKRRRDLASRLSHQLTTSTVLPKAMRVCSWELIDIVYERFE